MPPELNADLKHFLVSEILKAIPSHHDVPLSKEEIAASLQESPNNGTNEAVDVVMSFLYIFGILDYKNKKYKILSQMPNYFRNSLLWYFENDVPLLSNWDREGTAREISVTNLFERAPYFLKAMEERRKLISDRGDVEITPSREQSCSVIVVVAQIGGRAVYLHQWDQSAERFQLIGGKCRPGEVPAETAARELHEEISEHDLIEGKDFDLEKILPDPICFGEISRTYGAFTDYKFYVYVANFNIDDMNTSFSDRWIGIDEIRTGLTSDGRAVAGLASQIDRLVDGGLQSMRPSFTLSSSLKLRDLVDIKPGIFGIRINLNKLIWRSKK